MRAYRVGGSVRDELLGLPGADRDWVVVGATPQEMIDRGFRPVGKDFPVFLHPESKEEYALARTERKTGPGYRGFAVHFEPGVTLEEDLARRDLTINAMAQAEDGSLIDPFNGQADLRARVLRHVSESFTEDPVRILRLARFAARFEDFEVAPETVVLMRRMTAAGEVDALVAERVWQELARGLQERRPSRMIDVLQEAGALAVLLPELVHPVSAQPDSARSDHVHPDRAQGPGGDERSQWLAAVDRCARRKESLPVCYAVLMSRASQVRGPADDAAVPADAAVLAASQRLRVPTGCRDLAALVARERQAARGHGGDILQAVAAMTASDLLNLLDRCDAWRRSERLVGLLHAAAALADVDPASAPAALRVQRALRAANQVDQAAIAQRLRDAPSEIRDAISRERLVRIQDAA